jgi:hypothetical protein
MCTADVRRMRGVCDGIARPMAEIGRRGEAHRAKLTHGHHGHAHATHAWLVSTRLQGGWVRSGQARRSTYTRTHASAHATTHVRTHVRDERTASERAVGDAYRGYVREPTNVRHVSDGCGGARGSRRSVATRSRLRYAQAVVSDDTSICHTSKPRSARSRCASRRALLRPALPWRGGGWGSRYGMGSAQPPARRTWQSSG